ncbi:rCG43974 [Rattus norvegicus]|uniref:RCG43974 n=1 Tax=Rattus norvegicus TaxID=10116 RepID=A6J7B8_RAT|nr:rCG43974 [Rattus norvegicus]
MSTQITKYTLRNKIASGDGE